jgi:HAD superfamily hydrolase (TIGR01509 family)
MDGLLVDTEPTWTVAEEELADLLGGTWSDELKARIVGTRLDVAVAAILDHYRAPAERHAWASQWLLDRMVELFAAPVRVLPGVHGLLADLTARGVPGALVSSSYRALVDAVLAHGFTFDVTVSGDEVEHGKPHPEGYLTAASRLGVDPARCVVLEDSAAGVAAGLAASCAVVAVPGVPGVVIEPAPRVLVRSTLAGLTVSDLSRLVAHGR